MILLLHVCYRKYIHPCMNISMRKLKILSNFVYSDILQLQLNFIDFILDINQPSP